MYNYLEELNKKATVVGDLKINLNVNVNDKYYSKLSESFSVEISFNPLVNENAKELCY